MTQRNPQTPKRAIGVVLFLASLLMLLGYSTISNPRTASANVTNTPPATGTSSVPALSGTASIPPTPYAYIRHVATGTADIVWDAQLQTLSVKLTMSGLAPGSTHPTQLHLGSCETGDKGIVHALQDVVSDAKGTVTSLTTTFPLKSGIPASGWYINVQNGPTLLSATQKISIACGDIVNFTPTSMATQVVDITLWSTKDPNQSVSGKVLFSIVNNQILLTITAGGFVPNSQHVVQLYLGTCKASGALVRSLNPIKVGPNGVGSSVTVLTGVTTIPHNWYMNILLAAPTDNLKDPTLADPIACMNVTPSDGTTPHTPAA